MKKIDLFWKLQSILSKEMMNKKGKKTLVVLMSLLFGIVYMLTPFFKPANQENLKIYRLPIGIVFFIVVFLVAGMLIRKGKEHGKELKYSDKKVGIITFCSIVIMGLLYLMVFYPGTGMYDTLYILSAEDMRLAVQHPWFYCILIQKLVKIVFAFGGDYETALVSHSMIQIILTATVYTYCVLWLKKKKLNRIVLISIMFCYIMCPIMNLYMITLFKDIPFSLLILLWVPVLYDLWESDGEILKEKGTLIKISLFLCFSLLRNNGIYVSVFIILSILVLYYKKWKTVLFFACVLLSVIFCNSAYEKRENITHLFKETVGIPLQQIAATVYYDGTISEEQKEFIEQVMPIEFIKEKYYPYSVDNLKWGATKIDNQFLNANKAKFLKVWAELAIPNFKIYVKAYLANTYGFWSVDNSDYLQRYTTIYVAAYEEWLNENKISIKSIFPSEWQNVIEKSIITISRGMGAGSLFWIFVMMMLILYAFNDWKILITGMSVMGAWLTLMISTPVAFQWRYILYIPMTLPLLTGILFLKKVKTEK